MVARGKKVKSGNKAVTDVRQWLTGSGERFSNANRVMVNKDKAIFYVYALTRNARHAFNDCDAIGDGRGAPPGKGNQFAFFDAAVLFVN